MVEGLRAFFLSAIVPVLRMKTLGVQGVECRVYRAQKKHISKNKARDVPIKCLCLCAFWVPKFRV